MGKGEEEEKRVAIIVVIILITGIVLIVRLCAPPTRSGDGGKLSQAKWPNVAYLVSRSPAWLHVNMRAERHTFKPTQFLLGSSARAYGGRKAGTLASGRFCFAALRLKLTLIHL